MSKKTNKKKQKHCEKLPDVTTTAQLEIDFDDLQPLFDAQSRRLDDLLRRPEAQPHTLNTSQSRTFRIRMLFAWGILALYCVAAAICWGFSLWHYQYDIYFSIYTLFLEGCFLFLAIDTVTTTLAILRHDPASTPFDRMLRYSRRSGMRPLYLPQKQPRLATLIAHLPARRRSTVITHSTFNFPAYSAGFEHRRIKDNYSERFSILNFKHTATIGIAAAFSIILVSCATTVGDGYIITQDHNARIEAVDNVTYTIHNISAL